MASQLVGRVGSNSRRWRHDGSRGTYWLLLTQEREMVMGKRRERAKGEREGLVLKFIFYKIMIFLLCSLNRNSHTVTPI